MCKATLILSNNVVFDCLRVQLGNQLLVQSQIEQGKHWHVPRQHSKLVWWRKTQDVRTWFYCAAHSSTLTEAEAPWYSVFTLPGGGVWGGGQRFSIRVFSPSGSSTVLALRSERVSRFSCTLSCSIARSIISERSTWVRGRNKAWPVGVTWSYWQYVVPGRRPCAPKKGSMSPGLTHWFTAHSFFPGTLLCVEHFLFWWR